MMVPTVPVWQEGFRIDADTGIARYRFQQIATGTDRSRLQVDISVQLGGHLRKGRVVSHHGGVVPKNIAVGIVTRRQCTFVVAVEGGSGHRTGGKVLCQRFYRFRCFWNIV